MGYIRYVVGRLPVYSAGGLGIAGAGAMHGEPLAAGIFAGLWVVAMIGLLSLIWGVSVLCARYGGEIGHKLAGFGAGRGQGLQLKQRRTSL